MKQKGSSLSRMNLFCLIFRRQIVVLYLVF